MELKCEPTVDYPLHYLLLHPVLKEDNVMCGTCTSLFECW